MPRKKVVLSIESQIVRFFTQTPVYHAEEVLDVVKDILQARKDAPTPVLVPVLPIDKTVPAASPRTKTAPPTKLSAPPKPRKRRIDAGQSRRRIASSASPDDAPEPEPPVTE
jgi:hypothetical protein